MGHDIYGKRFIGNRDLGGWHTLGTVINDPDISVEEALIRAGISYSYFDAPVGVTMPDGSFAHIEARKAVFREAVGDDPAKFLGVVSDGYHYLQNYDLARGLDELRKATGWTFETAGALAEGAQVFMTLRTGKRSVFGDSFDTFVAVNDGKASGKALTIAVTPVREVCRNTVIAAESAATVLIKLSHDSRVQSEYSFWLGFAKDLQRAQDNVFADMEEMARTKINDQQAREIFARAYPLPKKSGKIAAAEAIAENLELPEGVREALDDRLDHGLYLHEYHTNHAQVRQNACFELYERYNAGQEHGLTANINDLSDKGLAAATKATKKTAGTAYAALQAGTEVADWTGLQRGDGAAASCLFGEAAAIKRKLWNACADYAAGA